jgi:hypothetical protein
MMPTSSAARLDEIPSAVAKSTTKPKAMKSETEKSRPRDEQQAEGGGARDGSHPGQRRWRRRHGRCEQDEAGGGDQDEVDHRQREVGGAPAVVVDQPLRQGDEDERAEAVPGGDHADGERTPSGEPPAGDGVHGRDDHPAAEADAHAVGQVAGGHGLHARGQGEPGSEQQRTADDEAAGTEAVGHRPGHDAEPEEEQERDAEHECGRAPSRVEVLDHGLEERAERVDGAERRAARERPADDDDPPTRRVELGSGHVAVHHRRPAPASEGRALGGLSG